MSIHKSLRLSATMWRTRNVLTRWERMQKLEEDDRWSKESVYGLPKVRVLKVKAGKKKKKKGPEDAAEDAAETPAATI